MFKFEFSACLDSGHLIFSFFGHRLLPKYEKSLKSVVFVCGREATPGFWVGRPSCDGTVGLGLVFVWLWNMWLQVRIGLDLDQVVVLKKCFDGFADSDGTIATDTIGSILSLMARKVSFQAAKLSSCYSCQIVKLLQLSKLSGGYSCQN